jgi:lipoprotein-anchoring transpeptidase ErfK/SrfK
MRHVAVLSSCAKGRRMISRNTAVIATLLVAFAAAGGEARAQYYYVYPAWRAYPPPPPGYRPPPRVDADDDFEPVSPYYRAPDGAWVRRPSVPQQGRAAAPAEANAAPNGGAPVDPRYAALPPEDRPETGPRKEVPPQFRRTQVEYPTKEPAGTIVIDTPNTYLYLVLGNGKAMRYGIGVGREGFTWSGTEKISRMAEWPDWTPPEQMIERQPYLPRFMAGGDGNPLGARALYLGDSLYRIHGTNQPSTIGSFVSSGCIRLTNEDITDLHSRVKVGTRVVVLSGKERPGATMPVSSGRGATAVTRTPAPPPAATDVAKKRKPEQEATTGAAQGGASAARETAPKAESKPEPARTESKPEAARTEGKAEHAGFEE